MSQEKSNAGFKSAIQKLGSYLSSMVMPNIGSFIAWGIITALFISDGWLPNEALANLVGPMRDYLLPILIGYTGGSMVYEQRGAVTGAIATMGAIVGASEIITGQPTVPMFIGAMVLGPLGGWVIKKFDEHFSDKIPSGFEMLVNNFSVGIIGFLLVLVGFYAVGPFVSGMTTLFETGVDWIISQRLLPLANVFIEPAKILFLNNAINHGILTPLGSQQVAEMGRSVLYLLEANPGPGLGVLLAFSVFGKGSAKASSPGAIIIHFLGGIHEIYFPYVMMKPLLFLAVILGGISGTFTFQLLNAALTGPASPGSIIAIIGMTAPGTYIGVIAGVLVATLVSFLVAAAIIKMDKNTEEGDFEAAQRSTQSAKAESKGQTTELNASEQNEVPAPEDINQIIFACDAGMGSSAMGASLLRKKAKTIGYDIPITNMAISKLKDESGTLIITQEELTNRAMKQAPHGSHVSVGNFLDGDRYDDILNEMQNKSEEDVATSNDSNVASGHSSLDMSTINEIIFPYHADYPASPVMGASLLRNELRNEGKEITVHAVEENEIELSANALLISDKETLAQLQTIEQSQVYEVSHLYEESAYKELLETVTQ
ncbi:PTS mannitol transporter subunit IICBA [Aerococcus kribbianus]|uniref:PTS system mannitol-specific EIICB component n=1 Tax=Aerococcus kribbianus TaxID=2999064 RepID=A0A9X3FND1_9LACT|nr:MULTISPECIES: PTS mannitol transporter subunit IICBA [unclassified Aerococcus]MCZ0717610.1 PTS mannitol transporter subunit IICBA [Aerococcus sp. YH-aer221]MCZ0725898.1 PTS mannitol transporter subunit IICBA [Aerococcus sp. YH-aer222]